MEGYISIDKQLRHLTESQTNAQKALKGKFCARARARKVQRIISVFDFTHRGLKKFKPVFSHNPKCFPLPFCKQAVQYRLKSGAGQGIGKVVAGVVAFLCSSDSDYMTGQTLNVDGAFEMN